MSTATTTAPVYASQFAAFCDSHPGLRIESMRGRNGKKEPERYTVQFDSFHAAQAFVRADAFTSDSARQKWARHRRDNQPINGKPNEWVGIDPCIEAWDAVVANPPQELRESIERCMASLDEMPTAFGERPARKNVRGLEEGDELDAVRMMQDHNLDRAWSSRVRRMRTRPVLRVALNAELRCGQGQEAIAWRGACALAIARKAEESGAEVSIDWVTIGNGTCSDDYERQLCAMVPLKKVGEFADRDALTAYCCHLASFRYFGFRLIAGLNPGATMPYWGAPLSLNYIGDKFDIVIDMHDVNCKASALRMISRAADIARAAIEAS